MEERGRKIMILVLNQMIRFSSQRYFSHPEIRPKYTYACETSSFPVNVCMLSKNAGREDDHSSMVWSFVGES
jgi:hypothetical protein